MNVLGMLGRRVNMDGLAALWQVIRADMADIAGVINEIAADHAVMKALVDEMKTVVNAKYGVSIGTAYCKTAPVLSTTAAGVTMTYTAFQYTINGIDYYSAGATNKAFTATNHDVTTGSKWGSFKVSIATNGTVTLTMSASPDYASEALAIAAVPATPAGECSMGYLTVQSTSGAKWDATTDALFGGTGGTPAAATNFYPATVYTGFATVANVNYSTLTGGVVSPQFTGITTGPLGLP
jgi:hypothetical protein